MAKEATLLAAIISMSEEKKKNSAQHIHVFRQQQQKVNPGGAMRCHSPNPGRVKIQSHIEYPTILGEFFLA